MNLVDDVDQISSKGKRPHVAFHVPGHALAPTVVAAPRNASSRQKTERLLSRKTEAQGRRGRSTYQEPAATRVKRHRANHPDPSPVEFSDDDNFSSLTNPLVTTPSMYITDLRGRKRFLGPSSIWAYSRHVMSMIGQYMDQDGSVQVPLNIDGGAHAIEFPSTKQPEPLCSMESLPSLDHALYLINTVKFHVCQTYHLFEEQTFMQRLYTLYKEGPRLEAKNRLWFVQYFLIMAIGKALLARGVSTTNSPGNDYFVQAMNLFPDVYCLYQDPILSVEVCCGLAVYLQSVDHRNSAYVYLGIGLQIALTQGYHRDLVGNQDTNTDVSRYRSVWWTLYILDRKFSSLIGAPSSVHDSDISVPLPKPHPSTQKSCALDMHVRLSRLLAKVLGTVYCIDGKLNSSFLKNIQATVRELAGLATELNASSELKLGGSEPISRISATLNLCYHQDKPDRALIHPVKALLKTSCESAHKSLHILTTLQSQDLLECFLPFDLDHAFSAGFVLSLISAINPASKAIDDCYVETTFSLLDTLIAGGNVPARFRRQELSCLRDMLGRVSGDAIHLNADQTELLPADA
ncbi:transcriptional regulatory [Fusarium albosuccineum]|uniref:Transcriptional regulatory n=1 Tax=Fusarium albosuccineum TaxID=1237068 RepID=A0A8H4PF60_9HYPO|nr:transcriptional regulatory [Fusarium albosuccineum]